MPDAGRAKVLKTFCEGDEDRVLIESMFDADLVGESDGLARAEIAKKGGASGKKGGSQLEKAVEAHLKAGLSALVVRDRDELSAADLEDWAEKRMEAAAPGSTTMTWHADEGPAFVHQGTRGEGLVRLGVVGVGDESGPLAWGINGVTRFAVEDHLLSLAADEEVYEGVSELSRAVPYDVAQRKLPEVVTLLRDNGIAVEQSKRLMTLLRGIAGFRASPAALAARLLETARERDLADGGERRKNHLGGLADLLGATARAVLGMTPEAPPGEG